MCVCVGGGGTGQTISGRMSHDYAEMYFGSPPSFFPTPPAFV